MKYVSCLNFANDVVVSTTTVVHRVAKAKILRPERLHYDLGIYNKRWQNTCDDTISISLPGK